MRRTSSAFGLSLALVACAHDLHAQTVVLGATDPIVKSMAADPTFTEDDRRLFKAAIARGPDFLARPTTDHGPPPPLTVADVIAAERTQEAQEAAARQKAADEAAAEARATAEAHEQRVKAYEAIASTLRYKFVRAISGAQGVAVVLDITNVGSQPVDGFTGYFHLTRPPVIAGDDEPILFGGPYDNFRYSGVLGSGQTVELATDFDSTTDARNVLSNDGDFLGSNQRFHVTSINSMQESSL